MIRLGKEGVRTHDFGRETAVETTKSTHVVLVCMTDGTDDSEDTDDIDDVVSMYEDDGKVGPGDVPSPDPKEGDGTDDSGASEGEGTNEPELTAPKIEPAGGDLEEVTGTFYIKHAEEKSVTLHEVDTAQICTLVENPGFERHDIVEATVKAQPPMGVSYLIQELESQYSIPVEESSESLTTHVRDVATGELDVGDAIAIEREGKGEIHILRVEPSQVRTTAEELVDDEMTYKNAARYDHVERVEIRTDDEDGIVSIRYLP